MNRPKREPYNVFPPRRLSAACRRDKAKVLMPENANIPLDDEDILDLTEIAEPGKPQGDAPDGPPEPGASGGMDFGADLDALLDSLTADGSAPPAPAARKAPAAPPAAPAAPVAAPAAAAPVAAPIADQTPVDHKVDPNEEMALPEMSDIDSLLAELGADIPKAPAAPAPEPAPAAPKAPAPSAPMPEFDGILAQAQAMEAQKAAEEAAMAAEPELEPEPEPEPEPAGPGPVAEPPAVESAPAAEAEAEEPAGEEDNIDLNELDALLDDILATAPEMSSAPAAAPPAPVKPEAAPVPPAMPEPDTEIIPVPDQALMPASPSAEELAALTERIQRLEESVSILESAEVSESMMEGFIDTKLDAKIAAIFEEGSPVMERIVSIVRGEIADGKLEFSASFTENLEKMAAAAAAKVIREEIAGLMEEQD